MSIGIRDSCYGQNQIDPFSLVKHAQKVVNDLTWLVLHFADELSGVHLVAVDSLT